jgi:hypothetical protein
MPPIDPEPNDEEKLEKIDQDFEPPMSLPSDVAGAGSQSTHPQTDDINDIQEAYDAGIPAEAGLPEERENTKEASSEESEGFDVEPS